MMNPNTNKNLHKNKMAANEKIKAILGGIILHGLEYVTRNEVRLLFYIFG